MRIRPLKTLPLRLRLKAEGRRNAFAEMVAPWLDRRSSLDSKFESSGDSPDAFLELEIHPYALVGHQVASWLHGYLWAKDLGLGYLGGRLSRDPLGLFNFSAVTDVPPAGRVKRVRLSWVADERDPRSLRILRSQVLRARRKYSGQTIIFRLPLDPARWNQVPAEGVLRDAILAGYKGDELIASELDSDYIAIHIRRGVDIHQNHFSGKESVNRWVLEEWHAEIVKSLRSIKAFADLEIRVYALGVPEDFPILSKLGVSLRLNGDRDADLIELASAKLLVLSPSSFSFTAALASRSPILGRVPWWHHIPDTDRWVQISPSGEFDRERLENLVTGIIQK